MVYQTNPLGSDLLFSCKYFLSFFFSGIQRSIRWGKAFGNNLHTCGVFLDFSKAFHCKLYDLAKHGIKETPLIIVTFQIGRF